MFLIRYTANILTINILTYSHYIYSNKYFDTKISLLKPQTVHFKSSHQQLKRSFYQYQFITLITFDNIKQLLGSAFIYDFRYSQKKLSAKFQKIARKTPTVKFRGVFRTLSSIHDGAFLYEKHIFSQETVL